MNSFTVKTLKTLLPFVATFFFVINIVQGQSILDRFQNVSLEELANPPEEDWLMWRRTSDHWGYSPLSQINKGNVQDLRLAWAWTMEPGLQETTPLVRNGVQKPVFDLNNAHTMVSKGGGGGGPATFFGP